jgi:hypothetical protein
MPATIRKGSKGATVQLCQERLAAKGYSVGSIDGDFGPKTERAVLQFQAAHSLSEDGIVGDKTWDLLLAEGRVKTPDEALEEQKQWLLDIAKEQSKAISSRATKKAVRQTLEYAISFLGAEEIPRGSNWGDEIKPLVDKYNEYWWANLSKSGYEDAKKRGYVLAKDQDGNHFAWCGMFVSNAIREGLELPFWEHKHGYEFKPEKGWYALPKAKAMPKPLEGHPWHYYWGGPAPVEEWARTEGFPMWAASGRGQVLPGDVFTQARDGSGSDATQAVDAGHIGLVVGVDPDDSQYVITIEGNISQGVGSRRRRKRDLRYFIRWHR